MRITSALLCKVFLLTGNGFADYLYKSYFNFKPAIANPMLAEVLFDFIQNIIKIFQNIDFIKF